MRVLRGFLLVAGAITLPVAFLAFLAGGYWVGLSGVLVGGSLVLFATWAWGYPVRQWICLGLLAAAFVLLGQVVLAIVGLLALFLFNIASSRLLLRRMSGVEFETVGPDEVMSGAEGLVAEFEAERFRRAGSYRARLPVLRKAVTATVLVGPGGDRFAVVTDRVWEVVSRLGHRWLITTSSGMVPLPAHVLRQTIARARPDELVRAHQAAIERIAAGGAAPDRFDDHAAALEAAKVLEADAAGFFSDAPVKTFVGMEAVGKSDDPPLGEDDLSRWRLDAWLYSQEPA